MGIGQNIGSFIIQSKRVWHLLKKPSNYEFSTVAKVSAIGILVMGAIGFLIAYLMGFFEGFFG